jgi:hypothetical protein
MQVKGLECATFNAYQRKKVKHPDPWNNIQGKLSGCRRSLKQWVRKHVNTVEEKIQ